MGSLAPPFLSDRRYLAPRSVVVTEEVGISARQSYPGVIQCPAKLG